jgi:hypothetical protein
MIATTKAGDFVRMFRLHAQFIGFLSGLAACHDWRTLKNRIWTLNFNLGGIRWSEFKASAFNYSLATAKNQKWGTSTDTVHINSGIRVSNPCTRAGHIGFLVQITTQLMHQLSCLPLAITQVASYINETEISVATYLSLLQSRSRFRGWMEICRDHYAIEASSQPIITYGHPSNIQILKNPFFQ